MLEVDVRQTGGMIDPLWFGHNLEHTRSCLWHGLSAELLRNRKFAGSPGRDGVAAHWYRIGPPGCMVLLERSAGLRGTEGRTYTAHFDPEDHRNCQRQTLQSFRSGAACGLGQGGLPLIAQKRYGGFLAMLSDRPLPVTVRVSGRDGGRPWHEQTVTVGTDDWTEHRFNFVAPATDPDARLEVTSEAAGLLSLGAASLKPVDTFHGLRHDVIDLLGQIGVPCLRWPGGNFAGSYIWQDGLLAIDKRAPLSGGGILPHTDGYDDHEIGTDEFIALCRQLGAEPAITINMGVPDAPEVAAAWVEYCNGAPDTLRGAQRARRGHVEPYNVKCWSLGNEMGWPHMKGPNAPKEYALAAAECARAIRQVDPRVVLIGSDGPNPDDWYATVPAMAGECFEHISCHNYTALMRAYEGQAGRREFRRLVGGARDNLQKLRKIRALVDANSPAGRSIGIAFDEWNVWHAWFRVPGVAEGIHTATMLNMFCRHAREVGMTMGAYFQPVNEGAILVEPDACRLTPSGEVFALFAAHHGNELIRIDTPADDNLDAAASLDRRAGQIVLTLVNPGCERPIQTQIGLKGVDGIGAAEGTALDATDFLPESQFARRPLDVDLTADGVLTVAVAPLAVALLRVSCRLPGSSAY
jgi:alpha-L-arabinofuranosidase